MVCRISMWWCHVPIVNHLKRWITVRQMKLRKMTKKDNLLLPAKLGSIILKHDQHLPGQLFNFASDKIEQHTKTVFLDENCNMYCWVQSICVELVPGLRMPQKQKWSPSSKDSARLLARSYDISVFVLLRVISCWRRSMRMHKRAWGKKSTFFNFFSP